MKVCSMSGCEKEARMAVKTVRPTREKLTSTLYFDDRAAPKTAAPYCKACGLSLVRGMVGLLVDGDNE